MLMVVRLRKAGLWVFKREKADQAGFDLQSHDPGVGRSATLREGHYPRKYLHRARRRIYLIKREIGPLIWLHERTCDEK
jgi:hypothetical protein